MLKQKIVATILIVLSILCAVACGDGTLAVFLIPAGGALFFAKKNWMV